MTCTCRKGARCLDCMESDALAQQRRAREAAVLLAICEDDPDGPEDFVRLDPDDEFGS